MCYFEEENDWWVSKHLKKPIKSTVTSLAWHPNSVLIAAGSTDSHARVFSGFVKGIDARPESSVWGERLPFNTVCGEYLNDSAGWIHDLAFSPSGDALAFAAHDSSITVVYPSAPEQPPKAMINVSTQMLPFTSLIWNGESEIIAAGHVCQCPFPPAIIYLTDSIQDCEPYRFRGSENGWDFAGSVEAKSRPGMGNAREESALNMFRQMDLKGKTKDDTQLKTTHQNTINTIRAYDEGDTALRQFSSKYPWVLRFNIANDVQPAVLMAGSLFGMPRLIGHHRCSLIAPTCPWHAFRGTKQGPSRSAYSQHILDISKLGQ